MSRIFTLCEKENAIVSISLNRRLFLAIKNITAEKGQIMKAQDIKPILCVVTSAKFNGDSNVPTGYWMSELFHPIDEFRKACIAFQIASIEGGTPPLDPASMDLKDAVNAALYSDAEIQKRLRNTARIDSVKPSDYSAVFFAGGHGPMWDFPNNRNIHRIVREIYARGGVVSAVCHGPCALINVQLDNGEYLVKGKNIVSFTDSEERENGTTDIVPFLLETELSNRRAKFKGAQNWADNVVVDGNLVTGQNPQSAASLGKAVAELLVCKK